MVARRSYLDRHPGGILEVRRVLPAWARPLLGLTKIRRSLRTGSIGEAKVRARILAAALDALLISIRTAMTDDELIELLAAETEGRLTAEQRARIEAHRTALSNIRFDSPIDNLHFTLARAAAGLITAAERESAQASIPTALHHAQETVAAIRQVPADSDAAQCERDALAEIYAPGSALDEAALGTLSFRRYLDLSSEEKELAECLSRALSQPDEATTVDADTEAASNITTALKLRGFFRSIAAPLNNHLKIKTVAERYIADKKNSGKWRTHGNASSTETTCRKKFVTEYARADAEKFRDGLRRLAKENGEEIELATLKGKCERISTFFKWSIQQELAQKIPFTALVSEKAAKPRGRRISPN